MNTTLTYFLCRAFFLAAPAPTTAGGGGDAPWWASGNTMLFAAAGIAMVFMLTSSNKAKRGQEKQRVNMLANLKRGDRVQTVGGILGSVVEARENEVVIKVDESTNTKIRVTRESIKRVTTEEIAAAK